jgi:hypothetical protein
MLTPVSVWPQVDIMFLGLGVIVDFLDSPEAHMDPDLLADVRWVVQDESAVEHELNMRLISLGIPLDIDTAEVRP